MTPYIQSTYGPYTYLRAQETLSDPAAAQDMARAAWRAGRAAASSVAEVVSKCVHVDIYQYTQNMYVCTRI